MEKLYKELWGKKLVDIIQDRTFTICRPADSCLRGYKFDFKATGHDRIPVPDTKLTKSEKVFKVLKIGSTLPCGKNRLLIRPEFEAIESELMEVESEKWMDVDSKTGLPADDLNLDFNIAGQPGSGK